MPLGSMVYVAAVVILGSLVMTTAGLNLLANPDTNLDDNIYRAFTFNYSSTIPSEISSSTFWVVKNKLVRVCSRSFQEMSGHY